MSRLYGWKFVLIVALPLILATLGIGWLANDLLNRVSIGANKADHERTRQIVLSALKASEIQLANTVTDNSYWDDAARQLYSPEIDEDWIGETWATSTEDGVNYNLMLVVDRNEKLAVTGFKAGKPFRPDYRAYFGSDLLAFIEPLPSNLIDHGSVGTIMQTEDGLAVVAAAPIVPTSEDLKVDAKQPRYLVFAKFLTSDVLGQIGAQYVIGDLTLRSAGTGSSGAEIAGHDGKVVAAAKWIDKRPGDEAYRSVIFAAIAALGFMVVVMIGIGALCWRLIKGMAKREKTAQHDASHDSLTDLPNRAALLGHLQGLSARDGMQYALAFADLDGFKEVNDSYDHETGDKLIKAISQGMRILGSEGAYLARLGGDEFVAAFNGDDASQKATLFAARLLAFVKSPFDIDGRHAAIGVSIGISQGTCDAITPAEIMRQADVAMYEAKRLGKNRFCIYDGRIDAARNEDTQIANDLRRLLGGGSIDIAYQPIVSSRSGDVVAVEALARWPAREPNRITPDRFVAVAEANGLIDQLGEAILRRACTDAKNWNGLRLSVNISPVQLRDPDFVRRTLSVIAETGFDPRRLELEVTEGVLLDDIERTKQQFGELRKAGILIALDDFGTGYSSVGYLRKLEFDRIKIDRSITGRVLEGTAEQNIVHGTVLMATGMTANVTAEGVENSDQIALLRLAGCGELQGFWFHRPMPSMDIVSLLMNLPQVQKVPA